MALNYLFIAFFIVSFLLCIVKTVIGIFWPEVAFGDAEIFSAAVKSTFDMAETGFKISIGYAGAFTLWLGLMKVGEEGGVIDKLSKWVSPLFSKLFPEVPKNHAAHGAMMMNISANMLGLDNAATPMGLRAMKELQEINPNKERASNAQIMFLVLNTSGLTIIPLSIMVIIAERSQGLINPTEYFLPILATTFSSTLAGLIAVSLVQKLKLYQYRVVWLYLIGISVFMAGMVLVYQYLAEQEQSIFTSILGGGLILGLITWFVWNGYKKKINVYDTFIEGAKEGFGVAVKIIPFLVGILVAIGLFRVSGGLDLITDFFALFVNDDIAQSLPTALTKPFSGGGARAVMIETIDSQMKAVYDLYKETTPEINPTLLESKSILEGMKTIPSRMVAIMQGSTETTFYVLAVYFGSVGIKNTRHAVGCGLIADAAGIIAAIFMTYLFFQ
ncbi:MAG: hypothetical protein KDC92_09430 [Bacteroidetes bacterium]|nr:hypothetical protein [Bacteroidota bacterium]